MESIRKELLNVWRKEDLKDLERRLVRSRDELNLHIVMDLRKQVSQFKLEQSHRLKVFDLIANKIIDAIINQQDVFQAAHNMHLPLMTLHKEAVRKIIDEHKATRYEILQEVNLLYSSFTIILNFSSNTSRILPNRSVT